MRKAALFLVALAFSGLASAHGRVVVGVGFGFPGWGWGPGPWYYGPPPYYYYPAPAAMASPPVTYVERQDAQQAAPTASTDYWYYCEQSKTYYPYVKTCPGGWQRVTPTPPPG